MSNHSRRKISKMETLGNSGKWAIDCCSEIIGMRRKGLRIGPQDKEISYDQEPKLGSFLSDIDLNKQIKRRVDMKNKPSSNQYRTNRCVPFCTAAAANCEQVMDNRDMNIDYDPNAFAELCAEYGTFSEEGGDYVWGGLDILRSHGVFDIDTGDQYISEGKQYIPKTHWRHTLASGKVILTGISTKTPMVGINYFWRVKNAPPDHCVLVVGYDDDLQAYRMWNTSWGYWGDDGNGGFWVKYEDVGKLDRGFIIKD